MYSSVLAQSVQTNTYQGRGSFSNADQESLEETQEYQKTSAVSFARNSNILSNMNKYGIPILPKGNQALAEDDDPFDAYMRQIENQATLENEQTLKHQQELEEKALKKLLKKDGKGVLTGNPLDKDEIENEVAEDIDAKNDSFKHKKIEQFHSKNFKYDDSDEEDVKPILKILCLQAYMKNPRGGDMDDLDEELINKQEKILDENGQIDYEKLRLMEKKGIQALQALDHSQIEYDQFEKNFYKEHPDITNMSFDQINSIRRELLIRVEGERVPRPFTAFNHLLVDQWIKDQINKVGYEKPTPIQSQALPCTLQGRDVIGIAKTGSGKTLSYLIPMLVHILDQRPLEKNEGPIGLVMAPTRELCQQIYNEYKKYAKRYNVNVLPIFGGVNQHQIWKDIKAGRNEIIIATPGRLIDMIRKKAFNLASRCTFLVIDEADQMFNMGFEYQIRSVVGQIRPDRQTLLFSATFKQQTQNLCSDILIDPIKIIIGKVGVSNEDISQTVLIFKKDMDKLQWLIESLGNFLIRGNQVLIFANQIQTVEQLEKDLAVVYRTKGLACLHGDKTQFERTHIFDRVKKGEINILISTNVASRGLDIPNIKTVINYDCAKDKDDHVHRIGRTGRADDKEGVAYTLITKNESSKATMLIKILEQSNQIVSEELEELALSDPNFRKSRVTIGIKNFNMKINVAKESKEMKKNARKIGDRTGIGFSTNEGNNDETETKKMNAQQKRSADLAFKEEMINQKIAREAQLLFSQNNGGNILDHMDEYSERFKDTMKMQFNQTFVSSGKVQTTTKEATVTFVTKGDNATREIVRLEELETPQISTEIYQIKKAQGSRNLYRDYRGDRRRSQSKDKKRKRSRSSSYSSSSSSRSRSRDRRKRRSSSRDRNSLSTKSHRNSDPYHRNQTKTDRHYSDRDKKESYRSQRHESNKNNYSSSSKSEKHRIRGDYHDSKSRSRSRDKYRENNFDRQGEAKQQENTRKRISKWDIKPQDS
ncbi:dead-box atp-dependent rna helicase 24-like [Stylonychia lemnae]|uniref:RNA helicase n=1 Tax=Stylonychia lemnae TaxID=5949 RepID=A0A078AUF3_STYLE|nr:dead-box atp-dependent rna helicase 24-like [Stylonychia lemnae]|eukprot:CDW84857.1 dead-box atp-dependent rna helicase 24-like [Stylonychia lemnae]